MSRPTLQEVMASPEFKALSPAEQRTAYRNYRLRFGRETVHAAPGGANIVPDSVKMRVLRQYDPRYGSPDVGQETDLGQDPEEQEPIPAAPPAGADVNSAIQPAPVPYSAQRPAGVAAPARKAPKPPYPFKAIEDLPQYGKLPEAKKAKVATWYYNQFEAPAGIKPEDSQTVPSFGERIIGGLKGAAAGFIQTAGVVAGDEGITQAGEELQQAGARTELALPYGTSGVDQFKNVATWSFLKNAMTHYLPQAVPYIAAGMAASAGVAMLPTGVGTIPGIALIGSALAMGGVALAQSFGSAHQEFLKKHPGDTEGANEYAWKTSGLNAVGAMAAEPLSLIGLPPGVAKGLVSSNPATRMAAQLAQKEANLGARHLATQFFLQASTGMGAQALNNALAQDNVDPNRKLTEGLAQSGLTQLAFTLPSVIRAMRVTKGAMVHGAGAAEEAHVGAGGDPHHPGGVLSGIQWDPSTGMFIPDNGYEATPAPVIQHNIDPSTGMAVPAGAQDWRGRIGAAPREPVEPWVQPPNTPGGMPFPGGQRAPVTYPGTAETPAVRPSTPAGMPFPGGQPAILRPTEAPQTSPAARPQTDFPGSSPVPSTTPQVPRTSAGPQLGREAAPPTPAMAQRTPAPDLLPQEVVRLVKDFAARNGRKVKDVVAELNQMETRDPGAGDNFIRGLAEQERQRQTGAQGEMAAGPRQEPMKGGEKALEDLPSGPKDQYGTRENFLANMAENERLKRGIPAEEGVEPQARPRRVAQRSEAPTSDEGVGSYGFAPKFVKDLVSDYAERSGLKIDDVVRKLEALEEKRPGAQDEFVRDLAATHLRNRAKEMLGERGPEVQLVKALEGNAAGEYAGADKVMRLAMSAADPNALVDHESMHAARDMLLSRLQNNVLEAKFREKGKWAQRVEKLLAAEPGGERIVAALKDQEERIAYGFELWRQGKFKPDTTVARIFEGLQQTFERVSNWVKGSGFQSAEDVFRAFSEGKLRDQEPVWRQAGLADLAARLDTKKSLAPTVSAEERASRLEAATKSTEPLPKNEKRSPKEQSEYTERGQGEFILPEEAAVARVMHEQNEMSGAGPGRVSMAQVDKEASRLIKAGKVNEEKILAWRDRKGVDAPTMAAANKIMEAHAKSVVDLVSKLETATPADEIALREKIALVGALQDKIQGKVLSARSEAGRTLNTIKNLQKMNLTAKAQLKAMEDMRIGKLTFEETASAIKMLGEDPAKAAKFLGDVWKPKWYDYPMEAWVNSLMSNPTGIVTDFFSTGLTFGLKGPEVAIASLIGKFHGGEKVYAREALAHYRGLVGVAIEGWNNAVTGWRTGESKFAEGKMEHRKVISGKLGDFIRMPSRGHEFSDEIWKTVNYRQALLAQATRQGITEGFSGKALDRRIADLAARPPDEMHTVAMAEAHHMTFVDPGGPIVRAMQAMRKEYPAVGIVLPFIKVPGNILKFAALRSPLAAVMPEFYRDFNAGGAKRDMAIARVAFGTMAAIAAAHLTQQGVITGDGPKDPGQRAVLMKSGWAPRSIMGVSYARMEPFSNIVGVTADFVEAAKYMKDAESDEIAAKIVGAFAKNMTSKTWMQGFSDFINAASDPDRYGQTYIQRLSGTLVPGAVAQVERTMDPTLRDVQSSLDAIKSRIPGLAQTLPARRDIGGDVIELGGAVGPDLLSPFYKAKPGDPIAERLANLGVSVSLPKRDINKNKLDPKQYEEFSKLTGERMWDMLGQLMNRPGWDDRSPDVQLKYIHRVALRAHEIARMEMKREYPELRRTPEQQARYGG